MGSGCKFPPRYSSSISLVAKASGFVTRGGRLAIHIGGTRRHLQPIAAAYGLTGLCRVLLERGESATASTATGRQALWFAVEHSPDLLKLLMDRGCDPNACTTSKETPFRRLLMLRPTVEGVRLMLDFKAGCKLKDAQGMSAAHWSKYSQDVETLRLLLASGADINPTDEGGETALNWLLWQNPLPLPMLEEFLLRGAHVDLSDKEDQQPLFEVCNGGTLRPPHQIISS